ncbi:hypothetical protein [Streptomyces sp. URMC 123]|uniref:hypothetical protein n=1 Tax=Streptomyces sp. URMC 123 TaxID=3423403 RepID=UPI003F1DE7F7
MSAPTGQSSTTLITAVIAVLIAADIALIASDLDNTIRYSAGAVILIALVAAAFQLGRTRRGR